MSNKLLTIVFLFLLFLLINISTSHAIWWMVYHKPEFKGKVIDAETKEPIEGAVVVVTYSKYIFRFMPESGSDIFDVRETLTDKEGYFYIPSYTAIIDPLAWESHARFIIFKPGYGSFPNYQTTPSWNLPTEDYFSGEVGKEGDLYKRGMQGNILEVFKVTFGIVELPKLKTREERLRAMPSHLTDESNTPILNRLIDEEDHNLGLK